MTIGLILPLAGQPFGRLAAYPVRFKSVQATFQSGTDESLRKTIDGFPASPDGWSVAPKFDSQHSVVFVAEEPVTADLLNLTMFFMSGRPNTSFARFEVFYTTDATPDFEGRWESLPVIADNSKIASCMAKDVLVMEHGKKILEDGDRKKRQTGAEKIAGSGDV